MNRTELATYDNRWFSSSIGASRVKQLFWYFINALFFKSRLFPISSLKVQLLRFFGADVGRGVVVKPSVNIKFPWKLSIGDNCWIGENVWIDNLCKVEIGNNVCLSQASFLLTGNHDFTAKSFDLIIKPIVLEDGVWIGAGAIVCPGVICGSHSVLCVGSVAVRNLEAYSINRGNPATKIKDRMINK